MVARGRFELPSMGLFLVRESKAHHWPGHSRPLLVHYTTGLQANRVTGQDPISLLRDVVRLSIIIGIVRCKEKRGENWPQRTPVAFAWHSRNYVSIYCYQNPLPTSNCRKSSLSLATKSRSFGSSTTYRLQTVRFNALIVPRNRLENG